MSKFWYLIAYDICHPRRLRRIHQLLISTSYPLQKSVFLYQGNKAELKKLYNALRYEMKPEEDDLRMVPVSSRWNLQFWGQSPLDKELHDSQWPKYKHLKVGEWQGRVAPQKIHFNTPPLRYA